VSRRGPCCHPTSPHPAPFYILKSGAYIDACPPMPTARITAPPSSAGRRGDRVHRQLGWPADRHGGRGRGGAAVRGSAEGTHRQFPPPEHILIRRVACATAIPQEQERHQVSPEVGPKPFVAVFPQECIDQLAPFGKTSHQVRGRLTGHDHERVLQRRQRRCPPPLLPSPASVDHASRVQSLILPGDLSV
jgi:hypothetical protein